MLENEVKEQVKNAIDGGGAAPVPAETPKEVPSPEVKSEVTPKEASVDVNKLQEQINNLNVALKEARNESKSKVDQAEVEKLRQEVAERESVISRLKDVFVPEKKEEPIPPKYLTAEEAETFFQQKQEQVNQEVQKQKQVEVIKSEVTTLEKEWNGTEGRPKYVDEEVLKWQQENNKLYLLPSEAFTLMKKNEIRDWEVKQVLSGKKKVENVEQPGVSPDIHTPADKMPKTDKELRDAISEIIYSGGVEM